MKGIAVKWGKSGRTVKGTYGGEVKWIEGQCSEGGKSGRTMEGNYGRWSEGHVKTGVQYMWSNNIRK